MSATMRSPLDSAALNRILVEGASALGVELSGEARSRLLDYVALLIKWNAVYNLTAIREPAQMMVQHILDSLAIVPPLSTWQHERAMLDVGAGAGLPGVVVAIARPDWRVTLNDVVQKKTAFLAQVKSELALTNLSVVTGRVETLQAGQAVPGRFGIVVSRAFAELADFIALARHLVADDGEIWAMKGVRPDAELARLPADAQLLELIRLNVPKLDAQRHLVRVGISRQIETGR